MVGFIKIKQRQSELIRQRKRGQDPNRHGNKGQQYFNGKRLAGYAGPSRTEREDGK